MLYGFESLSPHNFFSIFKRWMTRVVLYTALLILTHIIIEKLTGKTFWVGAGIAEVIILFKMFAEDSISRLELNTSKKQLSVYYYNIFQGQMENHYHLNEIAVDIDENKKRNKINYMDFYKKNDLAFTLKKEKDNFKEEDLQSLKETIYNITTPKS